MIERLYVHNFGCLVNFTLDFTGHPSALLIGRNGAGKSTVMRCLEVFQQIARGKRVRKLIKESDYWQHRTDDPMRFEVELTLKAKRYKYSVAVEWPENAHEARILDEELLVDGNIVFQRHQEDVKLTGPNGFNLDWHVFALPVVSDRPGKRFIQEVRSFFASMVLIAPVPAVITGFSEEPTSELERHAENFASCLRAMLEQKPAGYSRIEGYMKSVMPDFLAIENVPRGEKGKQLIVRFEEPDSRQSFSPDFNALSDGEKCFFLCAYLLASNAVGPPFFCLWDEPDSHLSLSEVGQFITHLRKSANGGSQFIATSHNPEAIRKFADENTFVLTRKSHLDPALVRPLAELSYQGDLINALTRDEIIGSP